MRQVANNGLGRVGRLLLRWYMHNSYHHFNIVAVNDPMSADNLSYLLKRDSVHGLSTRVVRNHFAKLQVWYDNEYGYACRCLDLLEKLPL